MTKLFGAIDLGATSGRVIAGVIGDGRFELTELHRFVNQPVESAGSLHWNFDALMVEIGHGLSRLGAFAESHGLPVESIGIDTWAVDFGALDASGNLLEPPRHYRDIRNNLGVADVHARIDPSALFAINGLQHQPFNTIFQLAALRLQDPAQWSRIERILLLPDLIAYRLTGVAVTEATNASTTGLLDANSRNWSQELLRLIDLRPDQLAPLVQPGQGIGQLKREYATASALANTRVVAVASHDTASAIVGTPLASASSAYLSSGTWSLLGLELDHAVLSRSAMNQNFTNELGAGGRIRFLKNLSGLWLVSQSIEQWFATGANRTASPESELTLLLAEAEDLSRTASRGSAVFFDVTDPEFLAPGDIPSRVQVALKRAGAAVQKTHAQIIRVILESLAASYAQTVAALTEVTGASIEQINVVGGGSANRLLCQMTADATGLRVLAGPVEATAIGNLMIQAAAARLVDPSLELGRDLIATSFEISEYQPRTNHLEA